SRLVAHSSSIKQAMEEAYINAMSGNPGPVHLDFARDAIELPVPSVPEVPREHPINSWIGPRPVAALELVDQIAQRVLRAERPVLWVGNGVNRGKAAESVLELAE